MRDPARKPATYEDLKSLPDNVTGQIIDGELYAHPRPAIPHIGVASSLGGELSGLFQRGRGGPGGWWILHEPELHLRADILVPDLAGWRRERLPALPSAPAFTLAPDWACEVLSPSTASLDQVKKAQVYARETVRWLWFVDPIGRTLQALELRDGGWFRLGAWGPGDKPRVPPFDAVELELDAIWGTEASPG